jgi:molybdopterin biosynthesis enzyme
MTLANGLAIVPEDKEQMKKGEIIQVMMLDWCVDI